MTDYTNLSGIVRSDEKHTNLSSSQYNGLARPGELVVDLTTYQLYIGNATGNLNPVASGGNGNGTPGGYNTQIQFNQAGVFGGSNNLSFHYDTNTFMLGGDAQISGMISVGEVASDLIPSANVAYSLGNATNQWSELWVSGNTIYINSVPITSTADSTLQVAGANVLTQDSNGTVNFAELSVTGNITTGAYFLGNGALLSGITARANTGNITFTDTTIGTVDTLSNVIIQTTDTANLNTYDFVFSPQGTITIRGGVYYTNSGIFGTQSLNPVIGNYSGENQLYVEDSAIGLQTFNGNSYNTWLFDTTGNISLPDGGNIFYANGTPYPETESAGEIVNGINAFSVQADGSLLSTSNGTPSNFVVNNTTPDLDLRNRNGTGLFTQTSETVIRTGGGIYNWIFDSAGNLSAQGNITATAFIGDGSQLSNISQLTNGIDANGYPIYFSLDGNGNAHLGQNTMDTSAALIFDGGLSSIYEIGEVGLMIQPWNGILAIGPGQQYPGAGGDISAFGNIVADGDITSNSNVRVSGDVLVNGVLKTNNDLNGPTVNGGADKITLYDFANATGFNYAIGTESNNIWFGVDKVQSGVGFNFYGGNTLSTHIDSTGNITTTGSVVATSLYGEGGNLSNINAANVNGIFNSINNSGNINFSGNVSIIDSANAVPYNSFTITNVEINTIPCIVDIGQLMNIPNGTKVLVSGVTGTTEVNGTWYAHFRSANQLYLYVDPGLTIPVNSTGWTPYVNGGLIQSASPAADIIIQPGQTPNVGYGSSGSFIVQTGSAGVAQTWTFDPSGNTYFPNDMSTTGNVIANYVFANNLSGTLVTNSQPNITSIGVLNTLNVSDTVNAGNINVTDNALVTGNLTVLGNAIIPGNITPIYGNSGQFFGNPFGFGALYAGIISGYPTVNNSVFQATASSNNQAQINFQNINSGSSASTDYVAWADTSNGSNYFIDLGIASSTFNGLGLNAIGNAILPNDSYLYAVGNTSSDPGGNLIIGAATAGRSVVFTVGGGNTNNIIAEFTQGNVAFDGQILSTGNVVSLGNISGTYILGNGAFLTGIQESNYSNANVAAYLPTYNGNLSASAANVTGNLLAGQFVGNGSGLYSINGANVVGGYGDANVAAYLPIYLPNNTSNINTQVLSANVFVLGGNAVPPFSVTKWFTAQTASNFQTTLFNIPTANVSSLDFNVTATDIGAGHRQSLKILATTINNQVNYAEYGTVGIGAAIGSFEVGISGNNLQLNVTPETSNTITYNVVVTTYS